MDFQAFQAEMQQIQVNWPVLPWPTEYDDNYNYQWEQKLIPYWKGINTEAEAAGVKIGIELHGGF